MCSSSKASTKCRPRATECAFSNSPAPPARTCTRCRIACELAKRANQSESAPENPYRSQAHDVPLLARLYAASVQGWIPTGERAGQPTECVQNLAAAPRAHETTHGSFGTVAHGLSLHAGVYIPGSDRTRLESVCRYILRPALACDRLHRLSGGRIRYQMRHPWRDGTTHMIFEPEEFIARLAALIPPPRQHQTRYHGILAPAAAWRDHVVPATKATAPGETRAGSATPHPAHNRPHRRPWAELLRRVFAVDVLECPLCGGRTRVIPANLCDPTDRALLLAVARAGRSPPVDRTGLPRPFTPESTAPTAS